MKHVIVSSQFCNVCNREVKVIDAILGREAISAGCERIFHCCPYCHTEIENVVVHFQKDRMVKAPEGGTEKWAY